MEKNIKSKKALRSLINDAVLDALKGLELPAPTRKTKKLINRNAKKLATIFSDKLKREEKKKRKTEKFMEDVTNNKKRKIVSV